MIEPRDIDDILRYTESWSAEADRYKDIHLQTEVHRAEHGCDTYPSTHRTMRLQYALARLLRARHILELGCALGYSTLWLVDAISPDGVVDTVERDDRHAELAERNFRRAGVSDRVRVLRGAAGAVIPGLSESYDLISIDTDWTEFPVLFEHLVRLVAPGGALVSSNIFPGPYAPDIGGLADAGTYRRLIESDPRLFTAYTESKAISLKR